jgi:hypothetical protein
MYVLEEYVIAVFVSFLLGGLFLAAVVILTRAKDRGAYLSAAPFSVPRIRLPILSWVRPMGRRGGSRGEPEHGACSAGEPEGQMRRNLLKFVFATGEGQPHTARAGSEAGGRAEPPGAPSDINPQSATADLPPGSISPADVYRTLPTKRQREEYTILKVASMLESEHIEALPRPVKRAAILLALQAAGVRVQDVVEDALQRTEALERAERERERAMEQFETSREELNRKLQAMIESLVLEYNTRMQRNNEDVFTEKAKLASWKQTKAQEVNRIMEALSYLTDEKAMPEVGAVEGSVKEA